jgi:hypothetical protein
MSSIIRELGLSHNVNFIRAWNQPARSNLVCEKELMEVHPGPAAFVIDRGGNFIDTRPQGVKTLHIGAQIRGIADFSSGHESGAELCSQKHASANLILIHY